MIRQNLPPAAHGSAGFSHARPPDVPITNLDMSDFLDTADRLHDAKQSHDRFLGLHALDRLVAGSRFFEKLHLDLHRPTPAAGDRSSSDPRGWSING
jgi:hypothetical protein